MSSFPYSKDTGRIVSDQSRFEYNAVNPRERPRDSSPIRYDEQSDITSLDSILKPNRRPTLLEVAERHKPATVVAREEDKNDIYDFYTKNSLLDEQRFDEDGDVAFHGYPQSREPSKVRSGTHNEERPSHVTHNTQNVPQPPVVPPKEKPKARFASGQQELPNPKPQNESQRAVAPPSNPIPYANDLPPMETPEQIKPGVNVPQNQQTFQDVTSVYSHRKEFEEKLIRSVMNRPVLAIPTKKFVGFNTYKDAVYVISANLFVYILEAIISIIVITLASILLSEDNLGKPGIYRFIIADGSICLFVSFLFFSGIINFEKRNGSFYCFLTTILNLVSFIMVLSCVVNNIECSKRGICRLRKALTSFVIISVFIWFSNLVVFLTTLYISRLNLLGDINFDFSDKGLSRDFNEKEFPKPDLHINQNQHIRHPEVDIYEERDRNPPVYRPSNISVPNSAVASGIPVTDGFSSSIAPAHNIPSNRITSPPPVVLDNNGRVVDPNTGKQIREFILNEKGELYEIAHNTDVQNKNRILVYTF